MKKALVFGDKHLSINQFSLSIDCLKWVEYLVNELNPDLVVYLGDDMHNHAILRSELLYEYKEHIARLSAKVPVFYIVGNHDCYKPNSMKYHAFQIFKNEHYKNFIVVDKVFNYKNITFCPYFYDANEFPKETKEIVFAHQYFTGVNFGGYVPNENLVDPDTVSANIIIAGHAHNRQSFGKVICPGSTHAREIRDLGSIKGAMLVDLETYKYEFYESPLPQWREITLDLSDYKGIDPLLSEVSGKEKDVFVLNLLGYRDEIRAFRESKEVRELTEKYKVKINPTFRDKEKRLFSIKSNKINDIIGEYIDNVYTGTLDKAELKNKALSIFQCAMKEKGV